MGRFYKTAKPEMMDFMFKVPEQAIMTAIKGADAQIEGQESYLTDLQKQLKTAALDEDEERRKAKVTELEGKIREHSLKIFENPLLAIKEQKGIRDLGQEIYKDLTEGELYAYNTNYNKRKSYEEGAIKDATGKDGRLNVQQVELAMNAYDKRYKIKKGAQFNKETGKFNPYGTELLVDYVDISSESLKLAKELVSKKKETWDVNKQGNYWYTTMKSSDVLGLDAGTAEVYSTLINNPKVNEYYSQKAKLEAEVLGIDEEKARERYFGVIEPKTGQLAMEPIKDIDGKIVMVKDVNGKEKPQMQFVNPGEIYNNSRSNVDLKDKNDIVSGIRSVTADPFATIKYGKDYEEKLKQQPTWDSENTSSGVTELLAGKTPTEIKAKLSGRNEILKTKVTDYQKGLLNNLTADKNLNEEQIKEIDNVLKNNLNPDSPNFNKLKTELVKLGIGMGDEELTGVTEIQQAYNAEKIAIENDRALLAAKEREAIKNIKPMQQVWYNINNTLVNDYEKRLKEGIELTNDELTSYRKAKLEVNNIISDNIDLKPVEFKVKIIHGNELKELEYDENKRVTFTKALDGLSSRPLNQNIGRQSNAKVVDPKTKKLMPFSMSNYNKWFDENEYTQEQDDGGNITITNKKSRKIEFKGKIGKYGVVGNNIPGIAIGSIGVTITGKMYNKETGETENISLETYIPKGELNNKEVSDGINAIQDELEFKDFEKQAEIKGNSVGSDKELVIKYNDYIEYHNGTKLWTFIDPGTGTRYTVKTRNEAFTMFEELKKQQD